MKKHKRRRGMVRVTHTPEYFIKRMNHRWCVFDENFEKIGEHFSESSAKEQAVALAKRFLEVPRDYEEKYHQKLKGFEFLHKQQMGIKNDDD
jgi:hypothetical protein